MKKVRAFIAVPINLTLQEELLLAIKKLKKVLPQKNFRWISANNLHLTLKFLGDTDLEIIQQLAGVLRANLENTLSFQLEFNKFHYLPSQYHPRVLTALFHLNTDIATIYHRIEETCGLFEFNKETRPFNVHVTVARIKTLKNLDETELSEIILLQPLNVETINIYQSDLKEQQTVYTSLYQIPLLRK